MLIIGLLDSQFVWYTSNNWICPSNITAFGNQAVLELGKWLPFVIMVKFPLLWYVECKEYTSLQSLLKLFFYGGAHLRHGWSNYSPVMCWTWAKSPGVIIGGHTGQNIPGGLWRPPKMTWSVVFSFWNRVFLYIPLGVVWSTTSGSWKKHGNQPFQYHVKFI